MLLALLLLCSCTKLTVPHTLPASTNGERVNSARTSGAGTLQQAESLFQSERYIEATEVYRNFLKASPASAEAAEAQYRLAFILSFYKNPDRNYAASLKEYQKVLSQYPDSPYRHASENMASLLSTLAAQKETLSSRQTDIIKLNELLSAEQAEVKRLSENLQRLQELEIQAEQKRTESPIGSDPPKTDQ